MFAKLLKQYLKEQRGLMLTLSGAALGAGLLGSILASIFVSNVVNAPDTDYNATGEIAIMFIIMGVFFTLYAYIIGVLLYQLYRFYRRHFSDEGYLTFTLPVTTHQLLLSSICSIFIWLAISGLVTLLSSVLVYSAFFRIQDWDQDLRSMFAMLTSSYFREAMSEMGITWFLLVFAAISTFLSSLILPLASITIGSLVAKKHKLLASFGIYYGISLGISTLQGTLSMVSMMVDMIQNEVPSFSPAMLTTSFIHFAIAVGGYFLMHHLMKKKLNLQ